MILTARFGETRPAFRIYIVVENAGYVGECDAKRFKDYGEAARFLERTYTEDERADMHVAICSADEDGENRSYEI